MQKNYDTLFLREGKRNKIFTEKFEKMFTIATVPLDLCFGCWRKHAEKRGNGKKRGGHPCQGAERNIAVQRFIIDERARWFLLFISRVARKRYYPRMNPRKKTLKYGLSHRRERNMGKHVYTLFRRCQIFICFTFKGPVHPLHRLRERW